jgi:hypothetical protein
MLPKKDTKMSYRIRSQSRTATDLTSYLISKAFVVVVIKRISLGFLTKLPTYDIEDSTCSSDEAFQVVVSNIYGETLKFEWGGDTARKVHRIFM